jgi:hypothetical protein
MLENVIRPSRQGTNNNCESMNHRFKISTDWKPQRLPELVNTIHAIVRLHFADLKRALFGQGNYEHWIIFVCKFRFFKNLAEIFSFSVVVLLVHTVWGTYIC